MMTASRAGIAAERLLPARGGLVMSDYGFLLAVALVVFWAIDPLLQGLDSMPLIKHVPMLSVMPAVALNIMGAALFPRPSPLSGIRELWRLNAPLFGFAAFVTVGSAFARLANGYENTFLTMGIFSLAAPLTAWFILRSSAPGQLVKAILYVFAGWAVIVSVMQIAELRNGVVFHFHAREHFVFPPILFGILAARTAAVRTLLLLLLMIVAYAAKKNTAYLVTLIVLTYLGAILFRRLLAGTTDGVRKFSLWWGAIVGGLILLGVLAAGYLALKSMNQSTLPTGNPEYRLITYQRAWNKFLDSPIIGNGFSGPASELFDKYHVDVGTQILPTHSDMLDIMANGGIVALALWASIFWRLGRKCVQVTRSHETADAAADAVRSALLESGLRPGFHVLVCMLISGLVVCTFNPILNLPNLAAAYWIAVGTLQAAVLHIACETKR